MPSLIGTDVTANYLKTTAPYSQFGTRELKFLLVTLGGADKADFDLTTTPTASNSRVTRVVRAIQNVLELYAVFTADADELVVAYAVDTANDSDASTNVPGGWGDLEADIVSALKSETGLGAKTVTAAVTVSAGFVGSAVSFA